MMNGQAFLQVENVSFGYGKQYVLKDVSLSMYSGEYTVLIGPNGSGKSTLIKLILGLLQQQDGQIQIQRSRVGYVAQQANRGLADFPATVREVVASGSYGQIGLLRWMGSKHWQGVERALDQVGLTEFASRKLSQLSGGQQQRVYIARALMSNPQLLILDEPTVGIDVQAKEQFYQLLKQLHQQGLSILLVSHDLDEVISDVDRVLCLNQSIYFYGSTQEFLREQKELLPNLFGVSTIRSIL
ncbi:zinc transport system ATP-binding protein [Seinonella peptonophila]|uniref:Zinc transport system ATP-binding protein n=1 Tax=Seinonella peptonophila TaxID=112248 RepID=A0A1M4X6R0_9BACL|nr:metal ABC transporter ATP-binding protein [Seinonella peptonophila]SHE89135.1 zinc transport system ATP-binding protein [Seinonella peptonophila]